MDTSPERYTFHMWRYLPAAPFQAWACEVVEAPGTADGYEIVDHDPRIADAYFMDLLHAAAKQPVEVLGPAEGDVMGDAIHLLNPGDEGHLTSAMKTVKNAYWCQKGRQG